MKKDKYRYQVGDILYEASLMYQKVVKWRIDEIFIERYISESKVLLTMTRFYNDGEEGLRWVKYIGDLHNMYNTREEAENALKERLNNF